MLESPADGPALPPCHPSETTARRGTPITILPVGGDVEWILKLPTERYDLDDHLYPELVKGITNKVGSVVATAIGSLRAQPAGIQLSSSSTFDASHIIPHVPICVVTT